MFENEKVAQIVCRRPPPTQIYFNYHYMMVVRPSSISTTDTLITISILLSSFHCHAHYRNDLVTNSLKNSKDEETREEKLSSETKNATTSDNLDPDKVHIA